MPDNPTCQDLYNEYATAGARRRSEIEQQWLAMNCEAQTGLDLSGPRGDPPPPPHG